jgi:hypothetical protein
MEAIVITWRIKPMTDAPFFNMKTENKLENMPKASKTTKDFLKKLLPNVL